MWALKVILLLLPVIVYCQIHIRINPGKTVDDTTVEFSGSDTAIISEKEIKTFKLDEVHLNRAVKLYKGKPCTSVFVKPPTPYGNVYEKYGWKPVERTLKPVRYKVVGIVPNPAAVVRAVYENAHDQVDATYSTSVEKSVEETMTHSWSTSDALTVGQEISYSVGIGAASVGGSSSWSYTSGWGEEKTETKTVTLGTTSTTQVTVPPGQKVVATLTADSATLEVEIYYEATLNDGHVFCNYADKYEGHHFWAWPLQTLQEKGSLPQKLTSKESLLIGFYTNARLNVSKEE